ncbi:MAG: PD-(D/E)XK nuclease family protein [Cellvibrionaceae bacterium]
MASALFNIKPLLPKIKNGAIVLTPNNRLRNQLRLAYSENQNTQVVRSPAIYSLTEWLNLKWEILSGNGHNGCDCLILNPIQQQMIWTQIVENSQFADISANYRSLVGNLMEAYRNTQLWEISLDEVQSYQLNFPSVSNSSSSHKGTTDYLLTWIIAFENKLKSLNAITPEQSQKIICDAFEKGNLPKTSEIFLQSFDDLPPLTFRLFQAASKNLTNSNDHQKSNTETTKSSSQRVGCNDFSEEVLKAAQWARNILKDNSESKIGIIVPSLGSDRQLVERIFAEIFEPQFLNPEVARYPLPFNISAGIPLANTPLINNTLLLLKLNQNELALNEWQTLLLSPFFSDEANERELRADVLLGIKKRQQFKVSTANVRQIVSKNSQSETETLPDNGDEPKPTKNLLSKKLQSFEERKRHHPTTATASEWIILFQEQLAELGWPGTRTLDSVEYQQVNQWYSLLEKLASLDAINENPKTNQEKNLTWSFSKILNELTGLAATTHFQPEVKGSPINILGTLEAAGLQFTHSWIMGMNNKDWPPKPNPNPLLPIQLQRKYQLPRASIERENRYAQAITKQLLQSAHEIVVSHVTQFEESESLPSALIEHIALIETSNVFNAKKESKEGDNTLSKFYSDLDISQSVDLVNCEKGPLLLTENSPIKGGSDILKQQALCPFNAFAKHRLTIRQPDEPTLALTALDKGNIIHNALDVFWSEVKSHENLILLTTDDIKRKISFIIESVFSHQYKRDIKQLGDFYYSLETERFINLLTEWLEFEKERPPFTVKGTEESIDADFSGLTFKLRVDRIDKNSENEIILIDYKTGTVATKKLKGPRPEEPQLPLYLLCYPEEVKAIAFAQVKTNDFQIAGIGEISDQKSYTKIKDVSKEKISPDWPSAKEYFKAELETLAQEYINGYCPVDFKTNDKFSEYMAPLNRSNESDYINYYASKINQEVSS